MQRVAAFIRLSRLKFLAGGLACGALGASVAAYQGWGFDWSRFALAQGTIVAFHLMTHYANDYFDRAGDAGAARTPFSGGSGVLVDGSLPAGTALAAALTCAAAGTLGCIAMWSAGRPAAALLALAVGGLAWSYSAPPPRLLARGLGELDVALVVAVLVPLCTFAAQAGVVTLLSLTVTLPGGAAMIAMMLAVEYPDVAVDRAAGKRNLIVRLGERRVLPIAYAACAGIYCGVALAVFCGAPPALAFLEALTLPLAWQLSRSMTHRSPDGSSDEIVAGRGVALFFVVSLFGLLAFASGVLRG